MIRPMKVLVTGGAGYVGSVVVRQLLAGGHQVHVVDNLMFGGETMLPLFINPNFGFSKVDICDRASLQAEMDGVDAVVHLAGESIVGRWSEAKKNKILNSRVELTQHISNLLAGLQHPPRAGVEDASFRAD